MDCLKKSQIFNKTVKYEGKKKRHE
jgi:hypothetical protein